MEFITLKQIEYDELQNIKKKYDVMIEDLVLVLSNNNIYCRVCNTLSKHNNSIIKHKYKTKDEFI